MKIIDKIKINMVFNNYSKRDLLENIDGLLIDKYKDDSLAIEYIFNKLTEKKYKASEMMSLLYAYTNENSPLANKLNPYAKNVVKSIILKNLDERKNIESKDLYCLLKDTENEKNVIRYNFLDRLVLDGDINVLKKYYKNTENKAYIKSVLLRNPKRCYQIACSYKSKEDENDFIKVDYLQNCVLMNNDFPLITMFACDVKFANITKMEEYVISYGDDAAVYDFADCVSNCHKEKLIDELKKRKSYYYLILLSCKFDRITNIDFSRLSVESFFTLLHYIDMSFDEKMNLLDDVYANYSYELFANALNNGINYHDKQKEASNKFIKKI